MSPRWISPSPGRRMVADLSWASLRVPRCLMTARLHIPRALAARAALPHPRPPWPAIFAKGLALVAEGRPALRRFHATLPWPRLLELDHATGCVMVERLHQGEATLTLARFTEPYAMPLTELGALLQHAKTAPPESTKTFRRILRLARLPWPLRRLMLRIGLAFAAPIARYGGSFGVSAVSAEGAAIVDSVSILPIFLSYGPIDAKGAVDVFIAFDHRVMDGADGAAALNGLQAMIEGPLADELDALRPA